MTRDIIQRMSTSLDQFEIQPVKIDLSTKAGAQHADRLLAESFREPDFDDRFEADLAAEIIADQNYSTDPSDIPYITIMTSIGGYNATLVHPIEGPIMHGVLSPHATRRDAEHEARRWADAEEHPLDIDPRCPGCNSTNTVHEVAILGTTDTEPQCSKCHAYPNLYK